MKPKYMEVYVSVKVDISKCKTKRDAHRKAEDVARAMMEMVEPFEVNDWYEIFRTGSDEITEWEE